MKNIFKKHIAVGIADCDFHGCLKTSALLRILLGVAGAHEEKLHRSVLTLRAEKNATWLMVRVKYALSCPVRAGERLTVVTKTPPSIGVFFYRDFELLDDDGNSIGEAVSLWVVSGKEKHCILTPDSLHALGLFSELGGSVRANRLVRLNMPKNLLPARPHRFGYSDTDINGHVTSARYADIACDYAALEKAPARYVSELQIDYNGECLAGEELFIETVLDGETAYVRGSAGDKTRFNVKMRLTALGFGQNHD